MTTEATSLVQALNDANEVEIKIQAFNAKPPVRQYRLMFHFMLFAAVFLSALVGLILQADSTQPFSHTHTPTANPTKSPTSTAPSKAPTTSAPSLAPTTSAPSLTPTVTAG